MITDNLVYVPLEYNTLKPTKVGDSHIDSTFGTKITRVTDCSTMYDVAKGSGTLPWVEPEYSTICPFSKLGDYFILDCVSYFSLFGGDGKFIGPLPLEISSSSEPKWGLLDIDYIYYIKGNSLKKYNVNTKQTFVVRMFSEYTKISGKGESDISFDGNHLVLVGDDRFIFVYELVSSTKGKVLDTSGFNFDSVYITSSNNVIVSWERRGSEHFEGMELFNSDMDFILQLAQHNGHKDICFDGSDEVLVWTDDTDNFVKKIRFSDGLITPLLQLDWSLAVHISCPDKDYAFVETYDPLNPIASAFKPYTNELLRVKLSSGKTERICHHRSRALDSYLYMPKVTCSHDGRFLLYASNFNLELDYADTYMIDLSTSSLPSAPILSNSSQVIINKDIPKFVERRKRSEFITS